MVNRRLKSPNNPKPAACIRLALDPCLERRDLLRQQFAVAAGRGERARRAARLEVHGHQPEFVRACLERNVATTPRRTALSSDSGSYSGSQRNGRPRRIAKPFFCVRDAC